MAAEAKLGTYSTPSADFGDREPPTFLEDALAAGRREIDARRQATADKKKRLAGQLKEDLQ